MAVTKIAKFSSVIRVIGVLLLIPSFLGIGLAGFMLLSTIMAGSDVMSSSSTEAEQAGAAIGSAIGLGISVFIGVVSLLEVYLGGCFS